MNVGNLLGFMFFVFGIFGLQLFMGSSRQKCFYSDSGLNFTADPNAAWKRAGDDWEVCGLSDNSAAYVHCEAGEICSSRIVAGVDGAKRGNWNAPPMDYIGFDNIFMSFLTILTTMSLEGWIDTMNLAWDTNGFVAVPYFIAIVVFGSLFAINLVVAVIYEAYTRNSQKFTVKADVPIEIAILEDIERKEKEEKLRLKRQKMQGEFAMRWRKVRRSPVSFPFRRCKIASHRAFE